MQRHFSQYFLSSFFCHIFSFLSFWGSSYMYVGGLDTVPQVTGDLFIGLVFSCINASGWRISIDLSINSLFLYLLCSIYSISSTTFSYVRCCIFFYYSRISLWSFFRDFITFLKFTISLSNISIFSWEMFWHISRSCPCLLIPIWIILGGLLMAFFFFFSWV